MSSINLALIASATISVLIVVITVGVKLNNPNAPEICTSTECVMAAANIRRSMDTSVKPCDDFYKFACGGWVKNNPIPPAYSAWSIGYILNDNLSMKIREILESETLDEDPVPLKKAKTYYAACLNQTDETEKLRTKIATLLGDIEEVIDRGDLGRKLGELVREVGRNYLVSLKVHLDEEDTSHFSIYLDEPKLGLNRAFLVGPGPTDNNNTRAYREVIEDVWKWVYPAEDGRSISERILAFERKIANITTAPEDKRNRTALYNPMQLKELNNIIEKIGGNQKLLNLVEYISTVFSQAGVPENLPELRVIVRNPEYFSNLAKILKDDPHNFGIYLKWSVMNTLAEVVSQPLRDIMFNYSRKTRGLQTQTEGSKTCAQGANTYFGMAISHQYVRLVFGPEFLPQINTMVENLRESFVKILEKTDWIGNEETRNKAKAKVLAMKKFIGYPEWLTDNSSLTDYYKNLTEPITADSHYLNYQKIMNWRVTDILKSLNQSKDTIGWLVDPTVVNAFYSPTFNSMSFPAGILQPPFYFPGKMIQSINYGGIGTVMGHEITHGFDDKGRQYDEHGNLNNWWDKATLKNYLVKAECFAKQYSQYEGEGLLENGEPVKVNGRRTIGENIADNGGVREAFEAYKTYVAKNGVEKRLPGLSKYTPEQLFFLSFAQIWCASYTPRRLLLDMKTAPHTPKLLRVKGVLQNSVEFADTWGCPAPDQNTRCQIW